MIARVSKFAVLVLVAVFAVAAGCLTRTAIAFIRLWQGLFAPLFGPRCRFFPSCSDYSVEALKTHGLFWGATLGAARVLRCNSLFEGGFDPVPSTTVFSRRKNS